MQNHQVTERQDILILLLSYQSSVFHMIPHYIPSAMPLPIHFTSLSPSAAVHPPPKPQFYIVCQLFNLLWEKNCFSE